LAQTLRWLGYALRTKGKLAESMEHLRDALAAAKRSPDRSQLASCYEALGNLARQRGRFAEAVEYHSQALELNLERGHKFHVSKDLFSIGLAALYSGDWKRSAETLKRSHRLSAELGLLRGLLLAELTLCRLHRRRGEETTAAELANRALARAHETSDARAEVLAYEELGDLAREAGDMSLAAAQYDEAWKRARAIAPEGDLVYELAWRRALVALDADRLDDAENLAREAIRLAEQSSDEREAANALRVLSAVQQRRGLLADSLASIEASLEKARSIQAPYETAEAHEAFVRLAGPDGLQTPNAALAHLFESRRIYGQLGARAATARVELEIARLEELILSDGGSAFAAPEAGESIPHAPDGLVVRDARMLQLVAQATELAATDATVLLQGNTGTGKEVLARLVHDRGPRALFPFVAVNCAALPTHLLESELFGHRRGSFTGAEQDRVGLFESAGEGTVFLDEIDKAPPEFQSKLLRVIEDRLVRPVGATREVPIQARILCATNRDLRALADGGRFLPDLFYRLAAFRLVVPDLRERPDDLWALVEHFLAVSRSRFRARKYRLAKDARAALATYEWPGNVRELRNVLEAAAFFTRRTGVIDVDDLPPEIAGRRGGPAVSLTERIETLERREIQLALRRARGMKALAARMLGVSRKGLLDRLRRLGME